MWEIHCLTFGLTVLTFEIHGGNFGIYYWKVCNKQYKLSGNRNGNRSM